MTKDQVAEAKQRRLIETRRELARATYPRLIASIAGGIAERVTGGAVKTNTFAIRVEDGTNEVMERMFGKDWRELLEG